MLGNSFLVFGSFGRGLNVIEVICVSSFWRQHVASRIDDDFFDIFDEIIVLIWKQTP